jgi:CRISPR system Cascade subunit CasD
MNFKQFLLLRFVAPSMFFGGTRIDNYNFTHKIPLKSAIVGLLGNALGFDRDRNIDDLSDIRSRLDFAARRDRIGSLEHEFQTVDIDVVKNHSYGDTQARANTSKHLKNSTYWSDCAILVAIMLDNEDGNAKLSLMDLANALQNPARPLFFGHKKHIPSLPIFLSIEQAADFNDIMCRVPQLNRGKRDVGLVDNTLECWIPMINESDFENLNSLDEIIEFCDDYDDLNHCYGGQRFMKRKYITLDQDNLIDLGKLNFNSNTSRQYPSPVEQINEPIMDDSLIDTIITEDQSILDTTERILHEIKLIVDTQKIIALSSMHRNNAASIGENDTDMSYEGHVFIACLLGVFAPKNFHIERDNSSARATVSLYSYHSLEKLRVIAIDKNKGNQVNYLSVLAVDWEASQDTLIQSCWNIGDTIHIGLSAHPIRRKDGVQRDAYESHQKYITHLETSKTKSESEIEELRKLTKEDVYKKWLTERIQKHECVQLNEVNLIKDSTLRSVRKKHHFHKMKAFDQSVAEFECKLTVVNLNGINEFLIDGVGKQQGFGTGMIRLIK